MIKASASTPASEMRIRLLGGAVSLRSNFPPFLHYAGVHLSPLESAAEATSLRLEASLYWHDGPPPADRHAADPPLLRMTRIDRDVYVSPGRLCWLRIDDLPPLHLRVDWDGERLRVRGDYYFFLSNSRLREQARRWFTRADVAARRLQRFTTLLYYLLYYPMFWLSETLHGFHPIHAAAVVTRGGALILAGPSGVGKSTLTIALAAAGAEVLSETFVLHGGTTVWPVREPILLDADSRRWLGDAMHGLVPIAREFVFARDGYHCVRGLADSGEAAVIVLPRRAPQTYVRAIAAHQAHQQISASDQIVKDLRRYWAFAAVMESLAPGGLMAQRERELARLTAATRCFELGLGPDLSRDEAVSLLMGLIESRRVAATLRVHSQCDRYE